MNVQTLRSPAMRTGVLVLMPRLFSLIVLGLVAACDGSDMRRLAAPLFSPVTESVEEIPAFYYRVTANYIVRQTGEEINFDFVVTCGGEITRWRSGSPSVAESWYPNFMAVPTQNGAAVGMRVPQACSDWAWGENWRTGEPDPRYAANPPDDFLPAIIWYPDVNYLGFGISYESDVAYDSPYSKLEFKGAGLAKSSREEWEAWRERSADGYKVVGGVPGPWGFSLYGEEQEFQQEVWRRNRGQRIAGSECYSAVRVAMSDELSADILPLTPPDAKRYWTAVDPLEDYIEVIRRHEPYNGDTYGKLKHNLDPELGVRRSDGEAREAMGVRWQEGGRLVEPQGYGNFYHDTFPVFISFDQPPADTDRPDTSNFVHVMLTDEWEGFSTCGYADFSREELEAYSRGELASLFVEDPVILQGEQRLYDVYVNDQLLVGDMRMQEVTFKAGLIIDREGYFFACCIRR